MSGINTGSGPGKVGPGGAIVLVKSTTGADGVSNGLQGRLPTSGGDHWLGTFPYRYNGSTWDRQRASALYTLQASVTKTANFSGTATTGLVQYTNLIVTLDVTVTDRADANETYDFYITTGDGTANWDVAHFTQIATTGTHRFTAVVSGGVVRPFTVTTAEPGLAFSGTGTMDTIAADADNGIRTLGAGIVRHGAWGDRLNHELVVAGTTPSITYSITFLAKT